MGMYIDMYKNRFLILSSYLFVSSFAISPRKLTRIVVTTVEKAAS